MAKTMVQWQGDTDNLIEAVGGLANRLEGNIRSELDGFAREWEANAQQTHAWQNRTGEAEQMLAATVSGGGGSWQVQLESGSPHGIWLELRWGGKYAVLVRSMMTMLPRLQARLRNAIFS